LEALRRVSALRSVPVLQADEGGVGFEDVVPGEGLAFVAGDAAGSFEDGGLFAEGVAGDDFGLDVEGLVLGRLQAEVLGKLTSCGGDLDASDVRDELNAVTPRLGFSTPTLELLGVGEELQCPFPTTITCGTG
jgi:hypothetical protein